MLKINNRSTRIRCEICSKFLSMHLFGLRELFYTSIVFRSDCFRSHPFLERISTKQNISMMWNAQGADLKQLNGKGITIKFLWWNLNYELTALINNELHTFLISNTFFQCCLNFSWIELQMLLNTYKHHRVERLFIFRLLDLSSPRSLAQLYACQPSINLATRTFFLPEKLHQLLSTNWIKVNTVVCSAMSLNKRIYLQ